MDPLVIGVAAFGGGVLAALLGYFDSQEPFDGRKFAKSLITALVAGMIFAIAYGYERPIDIIDIFISVAAGAGFDSAVNRGIGTIKALRK